MEFFVQRDMLEFEEFEEPEGCVFGPEDDDEGPSGDDFEAVLDTLCALCLGETGPAIEWADLLQVPKWELVIPFFYPVTDEGPKLAEMHVCRKHAAANGNDYRVGVLRETVPVDVYAVITALPLMTTLN